MLEMITHVERKIYPSTFLRNVDLIIEFNLKEFFSDIRDSIYLWKEKNAFRIRQDNSETISLMSCDGHCNVSMTDSCLKISASGKVYNGFQTIKKIYDSLIDYIPLLLKQNFLKIIIRKVNMFPSQKNTTGIYSINLLNQIFTDNLRGKEYGTNFLEQKTKSYFVESIMGYNNGILAIKYGFDTLRNDENFLYAVLDTSYIFHDVLSPIDFDHWQQNANEILFDVFHWSVNDSIIKIMEENN